MVEHLRGHAPQPIADLLFAVGEAASGVVAGLLGGARGTHDEAVRFHRGDGRRGPRRGHCNGRESVLTS